jgi:xanthine dehydrogenase accessory factor
MDGNICCGSEGDGSHGFLRERAEELWQIQRSALLMLEDTPVFCEKIGGRKTLVICGAGHVSLSVIELGRRIGFYVIVIEDRPSFADRARSAGADEVICDEFGHALEGISGSPDTYFVILTRGHRFDKECLTIALQKPNAYVGMMGSRRRVAILKEQLLQEGVPGDLLDQVHMPIGVAIEAETPEEIAVSIIAEIILRKNQMKKIGAYDKELLDVLADGDAQGRDCILATIIAKRGSTPRGVSTKMLVLADGTTIGTIGGGCAESEVIQECLAMLRFQKQETKLLKLEMIGIGDDEGMVCGGIVDVFLQPLSQE